MQATAILQEMGITTWQLKEPDRINAYVEIHIPSQCRLVFIAPSYPQQCDVNLIEKIVLSMNVRLEEVYYVSSEMLRYVDKREKVEWIWFCGEGVCEHELICDKQVHSHSLAELQNNPLFKKQLWQQIKYFKEV